jgi:hypothetical protein
MTRMRRRSSRHAALARLRGNPEISASLAFVRFEPYVLPKRSLTGEATERVDVRVLQAIYEFAPSEFPAFVGQQVDVFIAAPSRAAATRSLCGMRQFPRCRARKSALLDGQFQEGFSV